MLRLVAALDRSDAGPLARAPRLIWRPVLACGWVRPRWIDLFVAAREYCVVMGWFRGLLCLTACWVLVVAAADAGAQSQGPAGIRYSKVVYNEKTDSYFQHVEHQVQDQKSWPAAQRLATRLIYQNMRGRLAIVPDADVDRFLLETFKPDKNTWIGLRYFCRYRKAVWVSGRLLNRQDFQNWAGQWYRNAAVTCDTQRIDFMPVYYVPVQGGFHWQASGPAKFQYGYFVEYVPKRSE